MKRVFSILLFLTLCIPSMGQQINDWINHDQQYFKIPVATEGIYQLTYSQLQSAGFPVGSDPLLFQLYHRGAEQAVTVDLGADNAFGPGDVVRFYGRKNDGTLDAALYKAPSQQPHAYANLFSDTTSYFLTVGSSAGKRMALVNESNPGLSAREYHIEESLTVIREQYGTGQNYNYEIFDSRFSSAEGWTSAYIWNGQSRNLTFNVSNTVTTGAAPVLELLLVGRDSRIHDVEIYAGSPLRLVKALAFSGTTSFLVKESLAWSDVATNGTLPVQVRSITTGQVNSIGVSYAKISYPQVFDGSNAVNKTFLVPGNAGTSYIAIANVPTNSLLYDVTDPNNASVITTSTTTTLNAVVPSPVDKKLFLTSTVLSPATIKRVTFRSFLSGQQDYIIVTHPKLRTPAAGYDDPVKAYATYRASVEGGGFDTLIVNIDQLYDQFNYGERSPSAIYNFVKFISEPTPPKHLFLIGKALEVWFGFGFDPNGHKASYQDLVPTGGFPGSDMVYSAGLNGTGYEPLIATGRLTAMYPKQVAAYLDKIKEKEQVAVDNLWHKRILHLSGGIEEGEPESFRSILEGYATIAEGPYLGGEVKAIAKKSRDLEVVNISDEVNNGLSLVTFFGHSSTSTLDFDVGYVTDPALNYHNKGKYPMLLMNGCEVGAFFLRDTLFGESWVNARNRGAAAFIAHNSYGLVNSLNEYSRTFYEVAFADSAFFGTGIGEIQKELAKRYIQKTSPSLFSMSQIQQMILLGDPAVKLFGTRKPDLEIKESNISLIPFNDQKITAMSDSFAIKIILRNYGMVRPDTFRIEVKRTLADNSVITYDSLFLLPKNTDSIYFIIRKGNEIAAGTNNFLISVDADNIIDEVLETNNTATYSWVIPSNGTKNLYPANFAIVNQSQLTLALQSTDVYSGDRAFLIQIDTTNSFDSPFFKEYRVQGKVLANRIVDLADRDTTAYYWRTKLAEPLIGESQTWELSSFTFIKNGNEGWAQVHFPQMLDDAAMGLSKNEVMRRIEFEKSVTPVEVLTYGATAGKTPRDVSVKIKGQEYNLYSMVGGAWGCQNNTINLIAFDRRSTSPYIGVFLKWYELAWWRRLSCGREPFVINSFTETDIFNNGTRDIVQYVDNILEGDSVLLFNIGDAKIASWPQAAKEKLGEFGISIAQLDAITAGEPIVIFGRKGLAPGAAIVYRSGEVPAQEAALKVQRTVSGGYDQGSLSSGLIGPAQAWHSLKWTVAEMAPQDVVSFDVLGVNFSGDEEVILTSAMNDTDLSTINPGTYPYLRLKFHSSDPVLLTSAQLSNWIVHYTPVAEGVLLPDGDHTPSTLQEGESRPLPFRFVNISDQSFSDSLQVHTSMFNRDESESDHRMVKIKAPAPLDTTHFVLRPSTRGFAGVNDLQVFVNPKIQPEQHYDNNVIDLPEFLSVVGEAIAPLVDVTFDSKFITNGDYVSSSPEILVRVYDENTFLPLSDTLVTAIYLTRPCEGPPCDRRRIWFSTPEVHWTPGVADKPYQVKLNLQSLTPGHYTLRVEAKDATGNEANPYEIEFQVSSDRIFNLLLPYPNPVSMAASYGFELSGGDVPPRMRFEVFDLAGKRIFVREHNAEAFNVGRNLFSWDGVDSGGNPLRSGIYIVLISIADGADNLSTQGKVLISR